MIKIIAPSNRHPTNRSLGDFQRYWQESHGPLFSQTRPLRRYVQHLTLPEAYDCALQPTFDGASMFWFDEPDALRNTATGTDADRALREAVLADDAQLFDRIPAWPTHRKRGWVIATERVIQEGAVEASMVKVVVLLSRIPGLALNEFFKRWGSDEHTRVVTALPGLRRYVQNPALLESLPTGRMSHDGWSELWFDDLESIDNAVRSEQWQQVREASEFLVARPVGVVIARETIQKAVDAPPALLDITTWTEEQVRARLDEQGYLTLSRDRAAPGRLLSAARAGMLAVWTADHLVTIDDSRIDARPER